MLAGAGSLSSFVGQPVVAQNRQCRQQRRQRVRSRVTVAAGGKEVWLLDYGAGNVRSVRNAIKYLGYNVRDVRHPLARSASSYVVCRVCGRFQFSRRRPLAMPHTGLRRAGSRFRGSSACVRAKRRWMSSFAERWRSEAPRLAAWDPCSLSRRSV